MRAGKVDYYYAQNGRPHYIMPSNKHNVPKNSQLVFLYLKILNEINRIAEVMINNGLMDMIILKAVKNSKVS